MVRLRFSGKALVTEQNGHCLVICGALNTSNTEDLTMRNCYTFSIEGDTVSWYLINGEFSEDAKLLSRNARNL